MTPKIAESKVPGAPGLERPASRRKPTHRTGSVAGLLVLLVAGCSMESPPDPGASADTTAAAVTALAVPAHKGGHRALERLGGQIFFDQSLSINANQACAACHGPAVGWTGPDAADNRGGAVYEGSVSGRFGNRKPPSAAYATPAPVFDYDPDAGFRGGIFWDGRATGWKLGSPAADQAQGPFLNPLEQALPDAAAVVERVCKSRYAHLFRLTWGHSICDDSARAFDAIALSIAAFEGSSVVSPYSSKFDAALAGWRRLTRRERLGLELFNGKAHCSRCHSSQIGADGGAPVFTDFGYDNIGVPKNPLNPFYGMDRVFVDGQPINPLGAAWVDEGLGGFIERLSADDSWRALPYVPSAIGNLRREDLESLVAPNVGKQRVPTLRNVAKSPSRRFVKAYTHNGYFKTLKGLVHFYNTRDVLPRCQGALVEEQALAENCWPAPEVASNLNVSDVGNLGLSAREEDALEAFLDTLSDIEESDHFEVSETARGAE